MKIIISVDMRWDEEVEALMKSCRYDRVLLVHDVNLLELSIAPVLRKGWFGESDENRVLELLKSQYLMMRDDFERKVKRICPNAEVRKIDGNFREVLERELSKDDEVVFVRKRGYNPYWAVVKHMVEKACRKLKCEIKP